MIKRRFFKEEHGDKDEQSSSSSSSDSDGIAESEDQSEAVQVKTNYEASSSSSGYESENSSADEINADSADEDDGSESDKQNTVNLHLSGKRGARPLKEEINGVAEKDSVPDEMQDFVMKFKAAYRCRLCPRIVCLTEEFMNAHLSSKKHIRAEKLLKENRLKTMLNSDGEIENQETPAEMNARIRALVKVAPSEPSKKRNKGRQRQKNRLKKKKAIPIKEKTKESTKRPPAKKRRKSEG